MKIQVCGLAACLIAALAPSAQAWGPYGRPGFYFGVYGPPVYGPPVYAGPPVYYGPPRPMYYGPPPAPVYVAPPPPPAYYYPRPVPGVSVFIR
jgi:hypothetical protein